MRPDDEELDDKTVEANDRSEPAERGPAPRESVRDSIRKALKEHETIEDAEVVEDKDTEAPDETKTKKASSKKKKEEKLEAAEIPDKEEISEDGETEVPEVKEEPKEKVHAALPKELKDDWSKLSPGARLAANKLVKEASDQKAELGRVKSTYRELDSAIAPYHQQIQQYGATVPQTISRLFQWMDGLTGPHKENVYQQLGQAFGIKVSPANNQTTQPVQQYDQNGNPVQQPQQQNVLNELTPVLQHFANEVNQIKQQMSNQGDSAAKNVINTWAGLQKDGTYKNKPHFDKVRQLMTTYIRDGIVPITDGNVDLDAAYDMAVYAHPETRALILEEQAEVKNAAAADKAAKDVAAKKKKLDAAKKAGSSIRPSAPPSEVRAPQNLNGKTPNKYVSPRESIRAAIAELRDN